MRHANTNAAPDDANSHTNTHTNRGNADPIPYPYANNYGYRHTFSNPDRNTNFDATGAGRQPVNADASSDR